MVFSDKSPDDIDHYKGFKERDLKRARWSQMLLCENSLIDIDYASWKLQYKNVLASIFEKVLERDKFLIINICPSFAYLMFCLWTYASYPRNYEMASVIKKDLKTLWKICYTFCILNSIIHPYIKPMINSVTYNPKKYFDINIRERKSQKINP